MQIKYACLTVMLLSFLHLELANARHMADDISFGTSCIGYLLTFAESCDAINSKFAESHYENLPDASPEVTHYAREQLRLNGVPNFASIKVKIGKDYAALGDRILYITRNKDNPSTTYLDERLEQLRNAKTEEEIKDAQEDLLIHKAFIAHESQHMKNNDGRRNFLFRLTIPFVTYAASSCLYALFKKRDTTETSTPPDTVTEVFKGMGKIFNGLIHFYGNSILAREYGKYLEHKADEGIPNDLELLKAWKNGLQGCQDALRERIRKKEGEKAAQLFDANPFYYNFMTFKHDPDHPTPRERMRRAQQRIHKLEQLQKLDKERALSAD